ncbi:hypothetical protein IW147_000335 [Coemansia sp. RSA 720]|nr:hypothetical protein IW147_000335 [Coemansia sp. RSA 720]
MGKLVEHLKSEGTSEEEIREQRQVQIWSPARHAKQALPLRRSWVYAHVPLNTEILAQHIFEEYRPVTDKLPATSAGKPKRYTQEGYWEQVVDMKLKSFKDHAQHMFTGYVMTDGVSISVISKNKEKLAAKVANQKRKREEQAQQEQQAAQRARLAAQPVPPSYQPPSFQPVQQMPQQMSMSSQYMRPPSQQMLQQMPQQMSIPPSEQMSQQMSQYVWPLLQQEQQPWIRVVQQAQEVWETRQVRLSAEQAEQECLMAKQALCVLKKVYRYTRNQQRKETRLTKFKRILEKVKPAESLGAGSCVKPDLELYKVYLVARERVADTLTRFYNKTYTVHPTSSHQIHTFKTSEPQSFPLHCKLRLSAYVNRKQADQHLIKKLRDKFKPNAVIVIGDWSAPMNRYHEPIRGKSWRTLLKRGGFDVYLIKEYLTSKTCPNCNGRLSNTRNVPNPRPWRRHIQPEVKCHGLLSCQSEKCLESIGKSKGEKEDESEGESKGNVKRWWNRDLAAVLNFRHILFSLRETGIAPTRFQRGQPAEAPKAPKARKASTARKPRKTHKAPNPTNNLPAQL